MHWKNLLIIIIIVILYILIGAAIFLPFEQEHEKELTKLAHATFNAFICKYRYYRTHCVSLLVDTVVSLHLRDCPKTKGPRIFASHLMIYEHLRASPVFQCIK